MAAKSYYFENNEIKEFEELIENHVPKSVVSNPYSKVLEGINILVVDDNAINLIVADKTLKRFGATTFKALTGQQGINCFEKENIDLVLMDLQMPVMDGFETCKILKSNVKYLEKPTPVIAYTTFAFEEVKEKVIEYKMDGYIGKPFTQSQVISSLINILTKKGIVPESALILNGK
jgi:CheY-like chemotaxis protein